MNNIIVIGGPTASGKSQFAINLAGNLLAQDVQSVIINADSMQVYKEIPIITAQPTKEEKRGVPHKLYGVLSVTEPCSAGKWAEMAKQEIENSFKNNIQIILVGGSGLYIKTLIYGIAETPDTDPEVRELARTHLAEIGNEEFYKEVTKIDPNTAEKLLPSNTQRLLRTWEIYEQTGVPLSQWQEKPNRIFFDNLKIFNGYFLSPPRDIVYEKANQRLLEMIEKGVIEEVENLLKMNLPPHFPAMRAHGVPEIKKFLEGAISKEEAIKQAQKATRNFVKRQFTWFTHQLPDFEPVSHESITDII